MKTKPATNKNEAMEDSVNKRIDDCWEEYHNYTTATSNIGRQLAFATGAAFWLIYTQISLFPFSKYLLAIGFIALISYFIIDYLQHLTVAYNHELEGEVLEKIKCNTTITIDGTDVIQHQRSRIFFYLKSVVLFISCILLIAMFTLFVFLPPHPDKVLCECKSHVIECTTRNCARPDLKS